MNALVSHIDLRVLDLARSTVFYDAVLGVLGFQRQEYPTFADNEAGWRRAEWVPNDDFFGIVVDERHVRNANRIAFRCDSREQVQRVAQAARSAGGLNIDGPDDYDGYYAVFFEDPDGNLLEACFLRRHGGLNGDPG